MGHRTTALHWLLLALLALFLAIAVAATVEARVISYAPITDSHSQATYHRRDSRYFALIETYPDLIRLYDSTGVEAPRVIFPDPANSARRLSGTPWLAIRESEDGTVAILLNSYFSNDGGRSWKDTTLPTSIGRATVTADTGGPFTRARFAPVRLGTREYPFVVYDETGAIWRVDATGKAENWIAAAASQPGIPAPLLGSDITGSRFIVRQTGGTLLLAGFDGTRNAIPLPPATFAGAWLAADGTLFAETAEQGGGVHHLAYRELWMFRNSTWQRVFAPESDSVSSIIVPTHDNEGAWIAENAAGATNLYRFSAASGLTRQWQDATKPAIEAIHTGRSGQTLLLQAVRDRSTTPELADGPLLATWRVGEPAPAVYDGLYLIKTIVRGFVHLDVDRAIAGEAFVFHAGATFTFDPVVVSSSVAGGGADVLRRREIVRGSLQQRLVIPGVGHGPGANGTEWSTDLVLYNPEASLQSVELRYDDASGSATKTLPLGPHSIASLTDVVSQLFDRTSSGSLTLTPERGINAASRTRARTEAGMVGYAMPALDLATAVSPRFSAHYSGAFRTPAFRSTLAMADGGVGSEVAASGALDAVYPLAPGRQMQVRTNNTRTGLSIGTTRGFAVPALFATDNKTNDTNWIPPSVGAGYLPIVNEPGMTTEVHLYNPYDLPLSVSVFLPVTPSGLSRAGITLAPHETRVLTDIVTTLFGKPLQPLQPVFITIENGIRGISRTFLTDANGGTRGFVVAPMNALQIADPGETVEILGVIGESGLRTTISVIDVTDGDLATPPAVVDIEILGADGTRISKTRASIDSGRIENADLPRLIRGAVLIRVTAVSGRSTAYAVTHDETSRDTMYFAPYLAAQ